ncbi:MAG: ABC-F family ATP-binding cassette domain-containing protein, partial [Deltaproteobacteria bacterium]|nr:ABC-F family ATP-binding cassette domain-containing protein [Deltaproteobacteria bacterium]
TRRLLTAIGVAKSMGGRELFRDLSLTLSPGMRLGLVGGNGSGKTTLLRVLSGELFPDAGRVETAPALGVVRFDQQREQLDGRVRLRRALSPDGDQVTYRGQAMHVSGWARRFGFRVDQLDTPVADLSGGEQARVLIARLVVRPADLLLLDEPTNDLDIPTLEVLEESLLDFPGAVVIVTHDRYLMDRVANVLVGLDGLGASQFVADLAQWGEVRSAAAARPSDSSPAGRGGINAAARGRAAAAAPQAKPLTYAEELELRGMDDAISSAEASAGDRRRALEDPAIASDPARLLERHAEAEAARAEVDRLYARWEWLEAKRQA